MSKRRNNRSRQERMQRDVIPIATPRVLRPLIIHKLINQIEAHHGSAPTTHTQDRRRYQPARVAPVKTPSGLVARLATNRPGKLYENPWAIVRPRNLALCERRKARREVLHALRRTGKGSRAKRKYTATSELKC